MINKLSITAIICTYNEEMHLERCLKSIKDVVQNINIIDSYSTDRTKEIALKYDANYYLKEWTTFSEKFNWALSNTEINTTWVLRLDADEYLTDILKVNLFNELPFLNEKVTAIRINRLIYFMGGTLKFGGMNPIYHLKIWKKGSAICEAKWMDERMQLLYGSTVIIKGDIIDHNLNNISWWIEKHNKYAIKESIDVLLIKEKYINRKNFSLLLSSKSEERRKWFKIQYLKLPILIRPFIFFIVRYIFQGAFLEGKRGLIWTFLQCLWYRLLVDINVREAEYYIKNNNSTIEEYFKKNHNLDISIINKIEKE